VTNVPTLFNLAPGGGDPFDQLQAEVKKAASGVYDILGEMGRSKSGNVVYLAREVASGHLVAMKLSRMSRSGDREFSLEVVRTLDDSVPGLENQCPQCKALLADWGRFCTRCGADLSSANANPSASETIQLVDAVKQATAGSYEILGKMDRSASKGVVFFARDLKRGKLVALRLQRDASGDPNQAVYSLGETQVFRPLAAELGATQIGTYTPPPPVTPPPPRVEAPPIEPKRPAPPRKVPMKAVAGGVTVGLVAIIAYLAFKDSGSPSPVPLPPPAADTVVAAPPPPPPDPPPAAPPPPPSAAPNDHGAIQIGVKMPPGSRLTLDGRPVRGTTLSVAPGSHLVALDAAGFEPVSSKLTVASGETVRWRPKLVATTAPVASAPAAAPAAPPPAPRESANCASAVGKSDWTGAMERCTQEAQGGNASAQRNLAKLYDEGHGVGKDAQQAVSWYTKAAAAGDRESQVRLGYIYRTGLDRVKRDDRQSAYFFKLAAEGGSPTGGLEYGVALESGKGVDRNEREAADWYRKAGAAGDGQGLYLLGQLYERGRGVQQNQTEAATYYRQGAEKGNASAAYALGKLYKDGKGVEKSAPQAIEWFRKAAQKGHQQAANELRDLEKKNHD
jgi:TPR repeat protein